MGQPELERKRITPRRMFIVDLKYQAPKFRANDTVLVNLGAGPVRCIVVKVNAHLKPPTYVLEKEDGTAVSQAVAEASIRSAS
jgi:hypothetical protein